MEKGKLGGAIRTARISAGLSQEELSEIIGITPTHLKHIESEHRNPSIDVLWRLAETLHISIDTLLYSNDSESPEYAYAESLLKRCSKSQLRIITATLEALFEGQD